MTKDEFLAGVPYKIEQDERLELFQVYRYICYNDLDYIQSYSMIKPRKATVKILIIEIADKWIKLQATVNNVTHDFTMSFSDMIKTEL